MKMKQLPKDIKEIVERGMNWINATEGLLDTFERFGVANPGKCDSCSDYGCNHAVDGFVERWENRIDNKIEE